jgi:pimeloyl-ACP methyl ester carboxylesterase
MFWWQKCLVKCTGKGSIVQTDSMEIWYESFGKRENPCLLLIMGGGCQGILWPDLFCEKLASLGFFVIRYDNRDVGLSSYFDYKKTPYTLLDMAKDAADFLDALHISKAHVLGTSMGGAIAQLMAVHFPEKVQTLSLIATTCDLRNLANAILEEPLTNLPRPYPSHECLRWISFFSLHHSHLTWIQKIQAQLEGWKILNGPDVSFDKGYYGKMMLKTIWRQRSYDALLNHVSALLASVDLLLYTQGKIRVPALILQGKNDPIFPPAHGEFLSNTIDKGELCLIDRMGHNLNACFYEPILGKISSFLGKQ